MTVSVSAERNDYTGNGATSIYAYSFRITSDSDLLVTVRDTDDVETTLDLTTDYTVDSVGAADGGDVTLVDASQDWLDGDGDLLTGYALTIRHVVSLLQGADIRNQGAYYPEIHEDVFDYLTWICKQQQDLIDRSLKMSETVTGITVDIPNPVADSYLGWNADGDAIVNKTPTSLSDSGPTINTGDAAKIVNVNSGETAYQLSTFKALLEAITSGGLSVNTTLAVTEALTMTSILKQSKGADIASAGALTLGDDGNFFDITGTTNITSITAKTAGTVVVLQFDGILTVTDGSNLKIRGNFVTVAESTMMLVCDGTNWYEISRSLESGDLEESLFIKIWSGAISAIPSGYVICDGANSTPDLTDKFVIHADADAAGTNDVGDTGGASTITLSGAESGTSAHVHGVKMKDAGGGGSADVALSADTTTNNNQQNSAASSEAAASSAHSNRDKFYALAYVMKT